MTCEKFSTDLRIPIQRVQKRYRKMEEILFQLNHAMPMTPDYAVAVGNPEKVIKILDKDKF